MGKRKGPNKKAGSPRRTPSATDPLPFTPQEKKRIRKALDRLLDEPPPPPAGNGEEE